jgi:predicted nucleic acid-binding protein
VKKSPLVSDTTLLLYLGRLGRVHLLPDLFASVFVPEQVALELDAGRLLRTDTINPRALKWATVVPVYEEEIAALPANRLGTGEQAVIAYALAHGCPLVGLDDQKARDFAEEIGLRVIGTVGVLLQAKQAGLVSAVRPLLDAVQAQGFRMDAELYNTALQLAKETNL